VHLVEQRGDWVQKHLINHWAYQGTWCSQTGTWLERREGFAGFDADSYHILVKPVLLQTLAIEPAGDDQQTTS
jgi:hypothetical protein